MPGKITVIEQPPNPVFLVGSKYLITEIVDKSGRDD
jgi:hypothetical protein